MRKSRVDANQTKLVKELRQRGWRILHLHTLRHGAPDLLGLFRGRLALLEVKDGSRKKSERKLTDDELIFHEEWKDAPLYVLESEQDIDRIEQEVDGCHRER